MQPILSDTEPSEFFLRALMGGGNNEVECNCGHLHLCPDNSYYDDDEEAHASWQDYCESEKSKNPDKTTLHYGYDAVTYKELEGRQFVTVCECNGLKRYEDWIWANRNIIRHYLEDRVEYELSIAEQEKTLNLLLRNV